MNEYPGVARLLSVGHMAVILFAGAGCAGSQAATPPIRYADLGHAGQALDLRGPFVIQFEAGERLPVNFDFSSEDFELTPAHPNLELVAKHRCFVRFSSEGVRASLDPTKFGDKPKTPGSFRFGLNVRRGEQAKIDVAIATPRR